MALGENRREILLGCFIPCVLHKQEDCKGLSLESCPLAAALVSRLGARSHGCIFSFALLLPAI